MNDHTGQDHDPNGAHNRAGHVVPIAQGLPAVSGGYGPPGYPIEFNENPEPAGLNLLLDFWRIVKKQKWLIIGIAAAFVAISAVRTLMETPLYTATVRLQVDPVLKIVERGDVAPAESSASAFMRTQYELLSSRTMAKRVASILHLGNDSTFFEPRNVSLIQMIKGFVTPKAPAGEPQNKMVLERHAAGIILGNRSVHPIAGSRLFAISYSDPDPNRAQRIANAYADAYLASNIDKRFQANASAKTFLEDKIQQLK